MAALVASRLASTIYNEFKTKPAVVKLWSDSKIVLHWLRSDSALLKAFVGVRVAEILSTWKSSHWRHVPSALNPADDLSRGIDVKNMYERWFQGPAFLQLPNSEWPSESVKTIQNDPERKKPKILWSFNPDIPCIDPKNFKLETIGQNYSLLQAASNSVPHGSFERSEILSRRFEFIQSLVQQFWQRFIQEYLPTLQKRGKWRLKERQMKVGDLVLMVDYETPRGKWKLGRVEEVYPGKDGVVRNVLVKTQHGQYKSKPVSANQTVSAKSRLIEARAKVAELEVEFMYLKETQALKIASEELELKKVLAQARKAEQIYEQASNDDILPIPTSDLGTNNSNVTFDHPVPTYASFPPIQRTVSETSTNVNTIHTITSSTKVGTAISGDYISQGLTCPTSVNPRANHEVIDGTPST
ncbi:Hypothetical predicted protein [Paramuricea clavata]|uniref:DUF5641 domain-containing protein n=1 Tax=Paramuricea clavata TaxID=317549 RepID=A0A7D9LDS1_PARCT|nr:Hypothetical predicted protein [Paramuricea clavata]